MDNDMQIQPTPGRRQGNKRGLTIGLAAGLLGGTAAGLVFGVPGLSSAATPSVIVQQAEDTTDDTTTDATTDDSVEAGTRLREVLQPLVDDGTITSAQADAVTDHLVENRPERGGHGHGHGRFGGGGGRGTPFDGEVLETLGIDVSTLFEQLRDGASLADIATEQGVDVDALIDALVTEASEHIDEAVADGRLTAEEAAERKADLETRVTEMVNGTFEGRGFPGGRHGTIDDGTTDDGTTDDDTTDDDTPATTDN